MGQEPSDIERQIEETREHMGDTVSALSYKADVPTRMKDSVSDKKDAVVGKLSGAKDAITGTASDTTEGSKKAGRRAAGIAQENPLGLGIGAVAVGFLIGSLLPATKVEEEKLGPVASDLREQVTDLATEAVEHGKQVAHDVADAATETAKESAGQHAEQLTESAKESVSGDAGPQEQ
jgi:ElaB/YqjD/DUF883 family membrane-anchored ribosome-binding protein